MSLKSQVAEKREVLRGLYGGAMTLKQLQSELGRGYAVTVQWAEANRLGRKIGKRVNYDTDAVAKALVLAREF